jgi:hypothetical protein
MVGGTKRYVLAQSWTLIGRVTDTLLRPRTAEYLLRASGAQ